jgi:hypothetical protein
LAGKNKARRRYAPAPKLAKLDRTGAAPATATRRYAF